MIIPSPQARASGNVGLVDRVIRFAIGMPLLAWPLLAYQTQPEPHFMFYLIAISIYPLLTAVLGVDPFYRLLGIRSCGNGGRHQCGTFPYQVKAILGKAPRYCESADEHSLDACHDDPAERAHHAFWRVEQEPMVYPDDEAWEKFSAREKKAGLKAKQ